MPAENRLHDVIRQLQADPAMLDELIVLPAGQRRQRLRDLGLADLRRQDVQREAQRLLQDDGGAAAGTARYADGWVGAVVAVAAGALAA